MQTRVYQITDPMGATRIEIQPIKDGQAKRRERRAKERKQNKQ